MRLISGVYAPNMPKLWGLFTFYQSFTGSFRTALFNEYPRMLLLRLQCMYVNKRLIARKIGCKPCECTEWLKSECVSTCTGNRVSNSDSFLCVSKPSFLQMSCKRRQKEIRAVKAGIVAVRTMSETQLYLFWAQIHIAKGTLKVHG